MGYCAHYFHTNGGRGGLRLLCKCAIISVCCPIDSAISNEAFASSSQNSKQRIQSTWTRLGGGQETVSQSGEAGLVGQCKEATSSLATYMTFSPLSQQNALP